MANPPLQNVWHLRTVADVAAKPCMVCFKPSTAVLITPDSKDFFYVCRNHLKDKGFASPLVDPAEAEKKRKEAALKEETDRVVLEWKEKQATKEKAKKDKDEAKHKDGESKDKSKDDKDAGAEDKDKSKDGTSGASSPAPAATDEMPRVYALHRNFYNMRVERLRKAEMAKRNREILRNPTNFPAVPTDLP